MQRQGVRAVFSRAGVYHLCTVNVEENGAILGDAGVDIEWILIPICASFFFLKPNCIFVLHK